MAKNKKLLPGTIYIFLENDGDGSYPIASAELDAIDDGVLVGIYELRESKVKRVKHTLENNA